MPRTQRQQKSFDSLNRKLDDIQNSMYNGHEWILREGYKHSVPKHDVKRHNKALTEMLHDLLHAGQHPVAVRGQLDDLHNVLKNNFDEIHHRSVALRDRVQNDAAMEIKDAREQFNALDRDVGINHSGMSMVYNGKVMLSDAGGPPVHYFHLNIN